MSEFVYSSDIAAPVAIVWRFYGRPDAPALLIPPWQPVTVRRHEGGLRVGATTEYRLQLGPVRLRWVTQQTACQPQRYFVETTQEGPIRPWILRHEFEPVGGDGTHLTEIVTYRLPDGVPGEGLWEAWIGQRLHEMFRYRHRAISGACAANLTE